MFWKKNKMLCFHLLRNSGYGKRSVITLRKDRDMGSWEKIKWDWIQEKVMPVLILKVWPFIGWRLIKNIQKIVLGNPIVFYLFWFTPRGDQCLLLALCSGIASSGAQEIIEEARNKTLDQLIPCNNILPAANSPYLDPVFFFFSSWGRRVSDT